MAGNKNKNIILSLIVVAVWGAIIFKVVSYFNKSSVVELPTTNAFKTAGIKVKKEKFTLDASYSDPFIKEIKERVVQPIQSNSNRIEFQTFKPQVKWPEIKYSGLVETSNKEKRVGLLQVDKKVLLVNEGDSANYVTVIKMYKDSLRLKFSNEFKVYPIQK